MVNITRFLTRTNNNKKHSNLPLLNSLFVQRFSEFASIGNSNSFKTFMKWAKKNPHIMGFLNIISTDIISDNIRFIPVNENTSGRNKVKKSEEFWEANHGMEVAEETIYDMLITGIGYNWIGKINEEKVKEFCFKASKEFWDKDIEVKAKTIKNSIMDNNQSMVKKLRHVAATTMTILSNEVEFLGYTQRVAERTRRYDLDEIIQFRFWPLDGKIYPYAPMESILAEVYLLWLISQNYVSLFENGGSPDKVFILPKEIAGSKNHKYLVETLRKYKKVQNKHGNLVFTGDIKIEDLLKIESQMDFKDLALYLTGVLAMLYGVPAGRIPFLVGKAANLGDAGGLADSGYWRKISVWQSKIESAYNRQLWIPFFGTKMKFARGYKQDEVRETQNEVQKNSIVEQRLKMGLWTVEKAGMFLGIDPEEVAKAQAEKKKRKEDEFKTGQLLQNQQANRKVIPEPDNQQKGNIKKITQLNKAET